MARNTTPYLTLLRLRAMYPDLFYPQTWYETEEFANRPLEIGLHRFYVDLRPKAPSAVACAFYFIERGAPLDWASKYIWTSDYDSNGDQVYVGMYEPHGFQIHRHLTITDKWIKVGYTLE